MFNIPGYFPALQPQRCGSSWSLTVSRRFPPA